VSENVIIHNDGRMESVCKTHLGHNLPEGGVDRYCIDLVCMAGEPLSEDDERNEILLYLQGTTAINATELNTTSYTSSAEQFSGKTSNTQAIIISVVVVALVIGLGTFAYFHLRDNRSAAKRKAGEVVPENSSETRDSIDD
jgi:nitric oxide reductase large subunit